MKDDNILLAGVLGAVATLGAEILTEINKLLKLCSYDIYSLSSMIVTLNRPTVIMGFFITASVAGLLAVLLYLAFLKLGSQHLIIKCTASAIVMWIALELIFTTTIEKSYIGPRWMSSYYSHLSGAICFGIIEGILFKKYLFSNEASPEKI